MHSASGRVRRIAKALFAQIQQAGYTGGYSRVTDFLRAWRTGAGAAAAVNAFVPLSFAFGEAFQFDWSEEGLLVGGICYKVQVAHLELCASYAFWLVAYLSRKAVRRSDSLCTQLPVGLDCYMPMYCGPLPPSGGCQSRLCSGSLSSQALQCRQF